MKKLNEYILEAYKTYRLNNVKVKYDCHPDEFIIQAPETYQESDVQLYMDDKLLIQMPSGDQYAERFFGKNCDNIYDIHFEYDTFEHLESETSINKKDVNLEWDPKYNTSKNKDIVLNYFKITNLKYIIEFDRFDILNGNDDNVKKVLESVFMATVSNAENKYPIEITLDIKNIEYSK